METIIGFTIVFIQIFASLLTWSIFIWILMRWFARGKSPLGEMLEQIVQPILKPLRWARIGMFDLSPIIAFYLIDFIAKTFTSLLSQYVG